MITKIKLFESKEAEKYNLEHSQFKIGDIVLIQNYLYLIYSFDTEDKDFIEALRIGNLRLETIVDYSNGYNEKGNGGKSIMMPEIMRELITEEKEKFYNLISEKEIDDLVEIFKEVDFDLKKSWIKAYKKFNGDKQAKKFKI